MQWKIQNIITPLTVCQIRLPVSFMCLDIINWNAIGFNVIRWLLFQISFFFQNIKFNFSCFDVCWEFLCLFLKNSSCPICLKFVIQITFAWLLNISEKGNFVKLKFNSFLYLLWIFVINFPFFLSVFRSTWNLVSRLYLHNNSLIRKKIEKLMVNLEIW